MKKVLVVICALLILTGCSNKNKYEKELKNNIDNYYSEFVKGKVTSLNKLEVSISDFEKVGYNMESLKKCKKTTSVTATINGDKITDYSYNLNCK